MPSRFQPVAAKDTCKMLASLFHFPLLVFLPVDSSFVCLRRLREGIKIAVRDPSPDLAALLEANDYALIAGSFDVTTAVCEVCILFKVREHVVVTGEG